MVWESLVAGAVIGMGGTLLLDVYAWGMANGLRVPMTRWALVGRWVGLMRHGQFVQPRLAEAAPVAGEAAIGWGVHYVIGAGYGVGLVAMTGSDWLSSPTLVEPLVLALMLLVLPFLVMMPGMGQGVAAAKSARPWVARWKSVAGHGVFGLSMYAVALLLAPWVA